MVASVTRRQAIAGALAAVSAAVPAVLAATATAQPVLPERSLRIFVGFATGGGADVVARAIAPGLQMRTGRAVSVENRPGASGADMGDWLKKAPPDGSVVGMMPSTTLLRRLTSPATFPFDPEIDLAALGIIGTFETAICASPTTGARTLDEYMGWVKEAPSERRRFGTAAPDTFSQYFIQLVARQYHVTLEPVAYRGTGPHSFDLAAGRIPAACGGLASFVHHHRGDRLRLLVTSGETRNPVLPDVPTIAELGHPHLQLIDWYAFFAPAGLPSALIAAWNRDLVAAVQSPTVYEQLTQYGVVVAPTKPDACAVRLAADLKRWRALLDLLGLHHSQ